MLILHISIHVKAEQLEAFRAATIENSRHSRQEPGVVRFDFIQQADDPTRVMLLEVYRDAAAHASHRETPHYHAWAAQVTDMMAEPRTRQSYTNIYPPDAEW
jgi:quinol monooxygenase YgiN